MTAKHLGVENWAAVYTGKEGPLGGLPHSKLSVTSRGVFENMLIALDKLGIDPAAREVTATIQGFGDVGGSMVRFILEEKKAIKVIAVSDHTGILVCLDGFNEREAVRAKLIEMGGKQTLSEFPAELLGDGVELFGPDRIDEIVTTPSTIFIPAAIGNVIHDGNVEQVLAAHKLIVEGANIPFSPSAAEKFDSQGGKRIVDAFANGAGVFTSTTEILATQVLGIREFKSRYDAIVRDNEAAIRRTVRENSEFFWDEYFRLGQSTPFPRLVRQVCQDMTVIKSIINIGLGLDEEGVELLLLEALFPSIIDRKDQDEIVSLLGPAIVREVIATQLTRKIMFSHNSEWFITISREERDAVILADARRIIKNYIERQAQAV